MSNKIRHSGIVESVADGYVRVRIVQTSACAGCQIAGHCHSALSAGTEGYSAEAKEKLVEVFQRPQRAVSVGDRVEVAASMEVATRALWLGFGLPFLLLLVVLALSLWLTRSEALSGLLALGGLLPYYLILYGFRERLRQRLTFTIE